MEISNQWEVLSDADKKIVTKADKEILKLDEVIVEDDFSPPQKKARHDSDLVKKYVCDSCCGTGLVKNLKSHAMNTHQISEVMEVNVAQLWLPFPKEQITPVRLEEFFLKNDTTAVYPLEVRFK